MSETPLLSEQEIQARLARAAPRWALRNGAISRTWRTHGWKATVMALNAVAHLAELAWHHPEIVANYGSLEVRLTTHDTGAVTEKDIVLAVKIDALLDWRPDREQGGSSGMPEDDGRAAYFRD